MSSTAPQTLTESPGGATAPASTPHQALYRRWRAQTFSEIVGQGAVVETLRNAVRSNRVSHAVLFVGPRGTGKTSLARILAKALNCTDLRDGDVCDVCAACVAIREGRALDLIEIDAASNRGIDAIRDLRERIHYAPTDLRRKVYILDEAHQITKDAWNALLKSLEEPPEFVAFMFASTHPQEFPPAIISRLQRFDVRRLTVAEIEGKLARILAAESVAAEPGAIHLIARLAAGGMRDAESMLDQVLAAAGATIDESSVRDLLGLADAEAVRRLAGALVDGDASVGLAILSELDDRGRDVAVVLDQVVDHIRAELADAMSPDGDRSRSSALSGAAHRLAAIDPERRGVGGLRFQLELAILDAVTRPDPGTLRAPRPDLTAPAAPSHASVRPASSADRPPAHPRGPEPASPAEDRAARSEPPAPFLAAEQPAPPRTAPATPAPDAPASSSEGVDQLRAAWPEIVAVLSQSPPVKPLIAACRPVSVDGAMVTLGFPEDQAFLKVALERRRSMLEEGIGRVLGRAVNVRCVATNLEQVPALPSGDAADLISEARRIFADDLVDVGDVS
ncbi:MAG TPA: DNA polymerase III subunit gamma/tau [Patescibacteria group bacterium]|nr:DNA polymerase III subunit gamma/tau [Patescibacteria group bacterium]